MPDFYEPLNLDAPFDDFMSQLNGGRWSSGELIDYRSGLLHRIEQITRQLGDPTNQSRGVTWRNSIETAKKYFTKKLNAVTAAIPVNELPSAVRKPAGGHGFLVTFLIGGEHVVVATKRNPSELWADMIAENDSDEDKLPPAMIAFLNMSDEAARRLPESIWVDDL
jgi:hypothetical protein